MADKKRGIILKAISSFYYVFSENELFECKAKGIFKHRSKDIFVGDEVLIEILDHAERKALISEILERKNLLKRPPIANITQAILVFALKNPDPNLSLIDRFLVLAQRQGLRILMVFNKEDLDTDNVAKELRKNYEGLGYPIIVTAASERLNEDLKKYLLGHRSIVAGPSGVGKSTLINSIISSDLKTGEVSERIGRGRHTTRFVELIRIDEDSYIADSPGFSSIDLFELTEQEIKEEFTEFHQYDTKCKFGSRCMHETEPDCKVKEAVQNEAIPAQRYKSYIQLLTEIRANKRRMF